jgi:hypothetical protein
MDEYNIKLKTIQDQLNALGKSLSTFTIDWEDWTPNEKNNGKTFPIQLSINALYEKSSELNKIIVMVEKFRDFRAEFGMVEKHE